MGTAGKGDVTYKVPVNGSVALDDRDFNDLCRDTAGGTLDYIRFNDLPSSAKGTLYHSVQQVRPAGGHPEHHILPLRRTLSGRADPSSPPRTMKAPSP